MRVLRRGLRVLSGGGGEVRTVTPDWRAMLVSRQGAYAPATLAAAERDFVAYERWCETHDKIALPGTPQTVAAFVEDAGAVWATLTIRRRLHVIRRIHQWLK